MHLATRRVIVGALIALGPLAATAPASAQCTLDTCPAIYTPLRTSIVSLVPSALQTSMIANVIDQGVVATLTTDIEGIAGQIQIPTDPC
jgi:hypothetical protein